MDSTAVGYICAVDQHRSVRKLAPRGSRRRGATGVLISTTALAVTAGSLAGVIAGCVIAGTTAIGYGVGVLLLMVLHAEVTVLMPAIIGASVGLYFGGASCVIIGELVNTTNDETIITGAIGGALTGAVAVAALVMVWAHVPIGVISLIITCSGMIPATRRLFEMRRTSYAHHFKVLSIDEEQR